MRRFDHWCWVSPHLLVYRDAGTSGPYPQNTWLWGLGPCFIEDSNLAAQTQLHKIPPSCSSEMMTALLNSEEMIQITGWDINGSAESATTLGIWTMNCAWNCPRTLRMAMPWQKVMQRRITNIWNCTTRFQRVSAGEGTNWIKWINDGNRMIQWWKFNAEKRKFHAES